MAYNPTTDNYFVYLIDGDGKEFYIPVSSILSVQKVSDTHWVVRAGDSSYVTTQNVQGFVNLLGTYGAP